MYVYFSKECIKYDRKEYKKVSEIFIRPKWTHIFQLVVLLQKLEYILIHAKNSESPK